MKQYSLLFLALLLIWQPVPISKAQQPKKDSVLQIKRDVTNELIQDKDQEKKELFSLVRTNQQLLKDLIKNVHRKPAVRTRYIKKTDTIYIDTCAIKVVKEYVPVPSVPKVVVVRSQEEKRGIFYKLFHHKKK